MTHESVPYCGMILIQIEIVRTQTICVRKDIKAYKNVKWKNFLMKCCGRSTHRALYDLDDRSVCMGLPLKEG
jgi:hypothetical protein